MRKIRLRWFGYVMRKKDSEVVNTVMELSVEGRKPKKLLNTIEYDINC